MNNVTKKCCYTSGGFMSHKHKQIQKSNCSVRIQQYSPPGIHVQSQPIYNNMMIVTLAKQEYIYDIVTRAKCTENEWKTVISYIEHTFSCKQLEALPNCKRSESTDNTYYLKLWCTLKGTYEGWCDNPLKQIESYLCSHINGEEIDIWAILVLKAMWYITRKGVYLRYLKSFVDDISQPQDVHEKCGFVYTECVKKNCNDNGWEYRTAQIN